MKEYPVKLISELTMLHFAANRAAVRLMDGRTARLVRWRGSQSNTTARVEFPSGKRATIAVSEIVAVIS